MRDKQPKQVHIDHEQKMTLDEAISFLETIVTKLKTEKSFTLNHNGVTHHVEPANHVELEIKLEEENGKHQFEFELEWYEKDHHKSSDLTIE